MIPFDQEIELSNLDPEYCGKALLVLCLLLAILEALANHFWDQNIDDAFEFLEFFYPAILCDEAYLSTNLIIVSIDDPENDVSHHHECHPRQLERRATLTLTRFVCND